MASNPFHDLYIGEATPEDELVKLFSPVIVDYATAVFEPGNVVIRGLQGTGKTMLLNLLRPEARLAYHRQHIKFPAPPEATQFISGGVNLRKCGALEFVQNLEPDSDGKRVQELALAFGDFVNYCVVADLLATVKTFSEADITDVSAAVGFSGGKIRLDKFAQSLALEGCWFDALLGIHSFDELRDRVHGRIAEYRRYINLNSDRLPESITTTKTLIGDPILKTAHALRVAGILAEKTEVFIRIDQYEQLKTLNVMGTTFGDACQQLVHKALAARDSRVSYRIGTRSHGWPEHPAIYKTDDALELKRDFSVIDIDQVFRRRENARTWIFPKFAQDIFRRRVELSEYKRTSGGASLSLSGAFGKSPKPLDRAETYVAESRRAQFIAQEIPALGVGIPNEWKQYVESLADKDVLSAWLTFAWVRQKSVVRKGTSEIEAPPLGDEKPWVKKPYWHKERVQLALMQIASANRQALVWSGEEDVLSLSGGQIVIFLFLCQHIWDAWLRDRRGAIEANVTFPIEPAVQSQGVLDASIEWFGKFQEGGDSQRRKAFIETVGNRFYKRLGDDKAMSYPGANGFSLRNEELALAGNISAFLKQAVGYGDLYEAPHTSKTKGERRTKFYLAPIFSPYFRIPSVHTKEPEYVSVAIVNKWLSSRYEVPLDAKQSVQSELSLD